MSVVAPPWPWARTPERRRARAGNVRRRTVALLVLFTLAFVGVGGRLVHLQLVAAERYAAAGEAQRVRTVTLPAERGAIFARDGEELAMSIPRPTVWTDPRLVPDPVAAADALAPVLGQDEAWLRQQLSGPGMFAYLARKVDASVAEAVEALGLEGVYLLDEPSRERPAGPLASSVLGTVGMDNDGLSGLELQYDDLLTGEPGRLVAERSLDGRTIAPGQQELEPAERGADIVLTIDRALQYEAERLLGEAIASSEADGGMAVVMDPRNGEILAMANLEHTEEHGIRPTANNRALTAVFEPGSVNKVITLSAALEEGLYRPDSVLRVPDSLPVSTHVYRDHDPHPPADWTVSDILVNSSNVGTILIAQELGKERIDAYLRAFGFGEPTGLDFPGESAGLLLDPDEWAGTSIGSVPIGNGLAVTAVQMLSAYNVVANDGVYVAPRLVRATIDADGTTRPAPPPASRRVVSERTAEEMRAMLAEVVVTGTGTEALIEGYTVAGKTGTARKPSLTHRGYEPGAYMASFAGFLPAEDPQLSAIVVLDEPTPIFGGVVAAPVFSELAAYGLREFRIPPAAEELPAVPEPAEDTTTLESRNEIPTPLVP